LKLELRFVSPDDPLVEEELALRFRVLRDPLGLPPDAVRFGFEDESLHLLALEDGERVVGCVLFHPEATGEGRLYQMAVEESHRGRGVGRQLVQALEAALTARQIYTVNLHARDQAVGFYERLGYQRQGDAFIEVGIEHLTLVKALPANR